mmetsp:Transcript_38615/g.61208  ORF Transcript_38615/g.61208 Transcript_38615/m.61208 type:complete len:217 (-) Transcript_38615:105-755(-)
MTEKAVSVEYAKSGRASCGRCKRPIAQGEIRIGQQYSVDHSGETKYHLKCFKHKFTTKASETLFGFEKLKPKDQQKVSDAWEGKTTTAPKATPVKTTPKGTITTFSFGDPTPAPKPVSAFGGGFSNPAPAPVSLVPIGAQTVQQGGGVFDSQMRTRVTTLQQQGMITQQQSMWLSKECPSNPKATSIVRAAIKLYDIDHDQNEFQDTIARVMRTHS